MIELPVDYVTQYVYQYVGYVKERKNGILNGGCPICREGDSWGKKARFYYNPDLEGQRNTMYCHNCGYSSNSVGFIMEVAGLSFREVQKESKDYDIIPKDINYEEFNILIDKKETPTLPENSINLFDKNQIEFYKNNEVVRTALKYIRDRKLHKAPNRPKTFYLSLDDYTHGNRLIIPYYDNGKIVWYQSRKILDDDDMPKYLSKVDADRSMYNIDNIDEQNPYIFIFEGAIDAMFVRNATCVSGITEKGEFTLTELQETQLSRYPLHQRIWVLDSPYLDEAARNKSSMLYRKGEKVFQWPEDIGKVCKDFNDIIIKSSKTEIPQKFILGNLMEKEPQRKLDAESLKDFLKFSLKM